MKIILIFNVLILKEFVLPVILAIIVALQEVRVTKAKKQMADFKSRSESQLSILEMVERIESEYAELMEKYLNLKRELFKHEIENDEGTATKADAEDKSVS